MRPRSYSRHLQRVICDFGADHAFNQVRMKLQDLIQKRLKIAGAWWSIEQAKSMLSLRVMRANNLWNQYWKNAA